MRSIGLWLAIAFSALLWGGCEKSGSEKAEAAKSPPPSAPLESAARIHWLGTERLLAETNAAYFAKLWARPEGARLKTEALDKLAMLPWRQSGTNVAKPPSLTNTPAALLRPLLDLVLEQEVCLELGNHANGTGELALALRLSPTQAELCATNLAAVVESLTGTPPVAGAEKSAWRAAVALHPGGPTNYLEVTRRGDWSLVGFGGDSNAVLAGLIRSIETTGTPFGVRSTNYWIEATIDPGAAASALELAWRPPPNCPRLAFNVIGDGEYVKVHGTAKFTSPTGLVLEPWSVPTNIIREPLITFTAVQGLRPWLSSLKWVEELRLDPIPNQFFLWALNAPQSATFAIARMTNATDVIHRVGPKLEADLNAWITNHALGSVEYSQEHDGLSWLPVPLVTPTVQAMHLKDGDALFGRLCPALPPPGRTAPPELFDRVTSRTNLVFYDWEITEERMKQWLFLGQSARLGFRRPQLPMDGAGIAFLQAISPKLGNSITEVVAEDPNTLGFVRKAHLGLTAFELHVLVDWFASPDFPSGLHSLRGAPTPLMRYRAKTRTFEPVTNNFPTPPK